MSANSINKALVNVENENIGRRLFQLARWWADRVDHDSVRHRVFNPTAGVFDRVTNVFAGVA
jgi:hypothetical protein